MIIYFSNYSNNTHRFVQKLGILNARIPIDISEAEKFTVDEPYVLIVPTYGSNMDHVPHQVKKFLKNPENARNLKGVVGSGNTNFGAKYCAAAWLVAERFKVPMFYTFELLGTPEDVSRVKEGLAEFFDKHPDFTRASETAV